MINDENTFAAQMPEPLPETIEINGIKYRRYSDQLDYTVNQIKAHQEIAARTGLTLKQAVWFSSHLDDLESNCVMPD